MLIIKFSSILPKSRENCFYIVNSYFPCTFSKRFYLTIHLPISVTLNKSYMAQIHYYLPLAIPHISSLNIAQTICCMDIFMQTNPISRGHGMICNGFAYWPLLCPLYLNFHLFLSTLNATSISLNFYFGTDHYLHLNFAPPPLFGSRGIPPANRPPSPMAGPGDDPTSLAENATRGLVNDIYYI